MGGLNPIFGANALQGGRERPKGLKVKGCMRGLRGTWRRGVEVGDVSWGNICQGIGYEVICNQI